MKKLTLGIALFFSILFTSCIWNVKSDSDKETRFVFFSSCEESMQLAYKCKIRKDWTYVPMIKEEDKFYVDLKVGSDCWYRFVDSKGRFFNRDPFNPMVRDGHPFCSGTKTNRLNENVKYVSSKHFDLFTTEDTVDVKVLEELYETVVQNFAILGDDICPIDDKKIRYYSKIFDGMYAVPGSGEVVDCENILNSHEIIHVLLHVYPKFSPVVEGIAQCFQERGNRKPLVEPNCSLGAQKDVKNGVDLYEVFLDWNRKKNYRIVGSFIYYHLFVKMEYREPFVRLLKTMDHHENFQPVKDRYKKIMGKDIKVVIADWEEWVKTVDNNSDVYTCWN